MKQQRLGDDSSRTLGGNEYNHTKVVAWLLNRPVDSQKSERDGFFKKLNISLAGQLRDQENLHSGGASNPKVGGGSNLHFGDIEDASYDVSIGPQPLTGRTPTYMLNSTLTEKVPGATTSIGQKNV